MSSSGSFDAAASNFESYRPLPTGVPEAIRAAIWSAVRLSAPARVLEIGAGTGRIGKAFTEAGDFYVGVDTSLAMLQEFPAKFGNCLLVQADGQQLPFRRDTFDVVLLMQVLSSVSDWHGVLSEVRRVLRPGGSVAVGHTVGPESGIDVQLKRRLTAILSELQVDWHRPEKSRRQALAWLESSSLRHVHSQAASWHVNVAPQEFLLRHRTGARFAALPATVQEQALNKLRVWAETSFGSTNTAFQEIRSFELDVFEFREGVGQDFEASSDEKHTRACSH
jgi:ubiquinone/menaquinone biosynthesis C-methylase UbiE